MAGFPDGTFMDAGCSGRCGNEPTLIAQGERFICVSASAPLSFLESQTLHPCALPGRTTGHRAEIQRRELPCSAVAKKTPCGVCWKECSNGRRKVLTGFCLKNRESPISRAGSVPVLALLRDPLESWSSLEKLL